MKVAVVGNGVMGKGIVEVLLSNLPESQVKHVVWLARNTDASISSKKVIFRKIAKYRRQGSLSTLSVEDLESKLTICSSYDHLRDADIVIEAVTENKNIKIDVLSKLSEFINVDTIVASNTSSLSITEFSTLFRQPERFVGLHFFNPASVMSLVEVVEGLSTSSETLDKMIEFSKSIGKEPVVVNEAPGFIVNRMLIPMINEAIAIYSEGVADIEDIDKAMKLGANHPIGPLALSDLIGNDVVLSILNTLYAETGEAKYRPHALLKKYVRANKLGRKTKFGFYTY